MSKRQRPSAATALPPLTSQFAHDADMADLVLFFVDELQHRIGALQQAWDGGDTEQVRSLAHQLKGAAGGYGFPDITRSAAALEDAIKAPDAELSATAEKLEHLILLCRRATAAT